MTAIPCPKCGLEVEAGARYCRFCGHPLLQSPPTSSSTTLTITVPAGFVAPEAILTTIAWYLAATAIAIWILGFVSLLMAISLDRISSLLQGISRAAGGLGLTSGPVVTGIGLSALALSILAYGALILGSITATAAAGLLRRRPWAAGWTRLAMTLQASLSLLALILSPTSFSAVILFVSAGLTVAVWLYLAQPIARTYFTTPESQKAP